MISRKLRNQGHRSCLRLWGSEKWQPVFKTNIQTFLSMMSQKRDKYHNWIISHQSDKFFPAAFLVLMNYVEAANLSSFLWSQRGKVGAGKIFFKLSHLCPLSLFPPVVCLVAIFMVGCLVIIEARGNFEVETTLDRSCLLLPSTDFTVQTNTAKW